jgi:hypothetical protein
MTHLTPDELIDAMEGLLPADRQAHLSVCDACRRELAELSSVRGEAKQVSVPEPSPLFWQHFSDRVRTAVDAEALPAGGWPQWLRWPVLAPVAALALLVLALVVAIPRHDPSPSPAARDVAEDLALADDSWVMVVDLVGDMDWETARAAGVTVEPGDVDRAVMDLSPEEQQELTRLLEAELMRAKS